MTKSRFESKNPMAHICGKSEEMSKKFFNIIPSQDGTACLLLYGPIGDGDKDEKVDAAMVVKELMDLSTTYKKIDVRINSIGGEVFSGISIFNALKSSRADITIYIDGVAASIAAIIALCGKPLYMSSHARMMLHCVQGGEYGSAKKLRETAKMIEELEGTLASMIASRCNTTPEEVLAKYFDGKDHWITANEALSMGLIDGIYDFEGEDVPDDNASYEDIYQFFTNRLAVNDQRNKNSKNMAFIDDLRAMPSFKNATTDEQLMNEIVKLENSAAKVSALEGKVAELSAKLAEAKDAELDVLLNKAVADGKITEQQVPTFKALLKSDEASAKSLLNSMTRRTFDARQVVNEGKPHSSDILSMSWDEIDKAGRLAELKNNYPEVFSQKFEETFGKKYQ